MKAADLEMQSRYVKRTDWPKVLADYRQRIERGDPGPILNIVLYALSQVFAEEQSVVREQEESYAAYLVRVKEHRGKYVAPLMNRIDWLMQELKDKAGLVVGRTGKYTDSKETPVYYAPAVIYYFNRRDELRYFLEHPECPPSSNNVEAQIRSLTIIRNNSNFFQSMEYARGFCRLQSLIQTARLNGIENPAQWLTEYYYRLAQHCQRAQWIDQTRPDAEKRKDPYKKFVRWEYDKYWDSMSIEDLLPWNYKPKN